jgi:DNA polymerase-3 subunit epsilon
MQKLKTIFIDCETTGVDPQRHGLVQIAGSVVIEGLAVDNFNITMAPMPGDRVDPEALSVNGLTELDLATFQPARDAYVLFQQLLSARCDKFNRTDKFHFIGYNGDFDAAFVRRWFEKCGDKYFGSFFWWPTIDVAKLAGLHLMRKRHLMPDFKLKTVAKYCGIAVDDSRLHDAAYDIHLTQQLFDLFSVADVENLPR